VYFVDADSRNAATPQRATVISRSQSPGYWNPGSSRVGWQQPGFAGQQVALAPHGVWGAQNPVYMQPPAWAAQQPGTLGALFGGMNSVNIGTLIDMIGQGFAALRTLPTPPTTSGDGGTDIANLTLYQQSLAEYTQVDERIRTAARIVAKLLGAA
jgi:hypothetical protein